jgi:hypothetical protein
MRNGICNMTIEIDSSIWREEIGRESDGGNIMESWAGPRVTIRYLVSADVRPANSRNWHAKLGIPMQVMLRVDVPPQKPISMNLHP